MRAQVKETREVAKGTLLVVFDLLGREVDFKPGQYFWVTLLDPPYEDEKGPRRHVTVVTSPDKHGVLGLCTRIRDSAFKRSLAELPVGAEVEVEEPKGDFLLPAETDRGYVFIAGGIGITVFRCMLCYIAEEHLAHRVTLVYSNRDPNKRACTIRPQQRGLEQFGNRRNLSTALRLQTRKEDGSVLDAREGYVRNRRDSVYLGALYPSVTSPLCAANAARTSLSPLRAP